MRATTGTLGQVVDPLDFDAMQAAGIADPRSRAGLLEYLAGLGFTVDEMAEAERRGRLFGLAGDVLLQSGPQSYTLRTAADSIGVTLEEVERGWAMLGLTVADPDTPALSQPDVDALATWVAMRMQMGPDAADGYLRVLGATVARLAEAVSSMIRTSQPKMWLGLTGDELATAQAYRETAEFVPRVGAMIDAFHRHHLVSTRMFIESVQRGPSVTVLCGVGFADLSGFTALTQTLTPAELSAMLMAVQIRIQEAVSLSLEIPQNGLSARPAPMRINTSVASTRMPCPVCPSFVTCRYNPEVRMPAMVKAIRSPLSNSQI